MTEDRYYVEGDCILDRQQPELCCPFGSAKDANEAIERWSRDLHGYAWIKRAALEPEPTDEQKFDTAANVVREQAESLLTEFYGERCPEFEPNCICCQKWAELDKLLENPMR